VIIRLQTTLNHSFSTVISDKRVAGSPQKRKARRIAANVAELPELLTPARRAEAMRRVRIYGRVQRTNRRMGRCIVLVETDGTTLLFVVGA
jgi:hypothetical protein